MSLDDMTPEEPKVLATELGELYHQLRSVRSPYSGRIIPLDERYLPSLLPGETLSQIPVKIEPYAARVLSSDGWKEEIEKIPAESRFIDVPEEFFSSGGMFYDPPNIPLLEMTTRPFNRRIVQYDTWFPMDPDFLEPQQNLRDMMDVIIDEERVEDPSNDFQLVHVDLFPRNIMVDLDSSPMITGIIDWDEAVFAPSFVANVAPNWLWELPLPEKEDIMDPASADPGADEKKGTVDMKLETLDRNTRIPPTDELQEVKRVWEEAVGPECVESAKNPYALLARRMLKFAEMWLWRQDMHALYEETIEEFNVLRVEVARACAAAQGDPEAESEEEPEDKTEEIPEDDNDSAWETCPGDEDEDEDLEESSKIALNCRKDKV